VLDWRRNWQKKKRKEGLKWKKKNEGDERKKNELNNYNNRSKTSNYSQLEMCRFVVLFYLSALHYVISLSGLVCIR